jgi:putative transposase
LLKEYGIDPQAQAVLLLSDIDELIHHAVADVYGRDLHTGIKAIPEQVWRDDAARHHVEYAHDLGALDRSLARIGPERTLSRKGIEWQTLIYSSEAVFDLLNDLVPVGRRRNRAEGTVPVKFKYWPEDMAKISIWNEVRRTYEDVPCIDREYADGLSEHAHQAVKHYAQLNQLAFSSSAERCAAKSKLNERIQSLVNDRLIGTRKKAARISPSLGGFPVRPQLPPELPDPSATRIETVSNRRDGDQPQRSAARSHGQKRRKADPTQLSKPGGRAGQAAAPIVPSPSLPDPFATFDRQSLIAKARAKVGT